ncbi:hypothetical protein MKW92_038722 [Papaver armeniacum]|nr:hypothetical protein MKW92_038722 [Papaver armeniacum]
MAMAYHNTKRRYIEREVEEENRHRKRSRSDSEIKQVEKQKDDEQHSKDLAAIKEQYMGTTKQKKRVMKPSDKFLVLFDWEISGRYFKDMNVLYQNPHEAQLLFGRGFRAGIDRREQKKKLADDLYDMKMDRHWSDKKVEDMTERDWRIFKEDYNISYKGSKIPKPMRNWHESNLISTELLRAVEKLGYKTPSPIQMAAIPLGLQQRDVIAIAETGSGKTAAFVLPMLEYISRLPRITKENADQGPYAVVLAPSRELAQQIEVETVKLARYTGIRVVSIVGGHSYEEQASKVSKGCEIVIATPGPRCNYVVLDEADRMIDMDEELDSKRIYRTTYMFSATMPPAVERLARKYLRNPVVVNIGTATKLIMQNVIMIKDSEKFTRLQILLSELNDKTAIVFTNTKQSSNSVYKNLDNKGYRVTVLHGGMSQEQREISLEDVAGRGIDIKKDVAHVINYDMPASIEKYTHRIGRTGRAGKTGVATTFLTLHDTDVFSDLKKTLIQSNSRVPPELARQEAEKFKPRPARRNDYN